MSALFNMRQFDNESNDHYMERFKSNVHTVELPKGGHIFCSRELLSCVDEANPTDEEIRQEEEKLKAVILLKRSDEGRYKKVLMDLKDGSYLGRDDYPKSISAAYDLLNRPSGKLDRAISRPSNRSNRRSGGISGNFAQRGPTHSREDECQPIAGTDGRLVPHILRYNCNCYGHYSGQCPEENRRVTRGSTSVQLGTSLVQRGDEDKAFIPKTWVLLDKCSTHCAFWNLDLTDNIRDCSEEEELHIETNGGSLVYSKVRDCKLVPVKMFFNPKSIANVLSLSMVGKLPDVKIKMNPKVEKAITVDFNNGKRLKFSECGDGLYYHDWNTTIHNTNNTPVSNYSDYFSYNLLNTSVENNKKMYTNRQVNKAIEARQLHHTLCRPSTDNFKRYVKNNMLKNCKNTSEDIDRAEKIFGKYKLILQGKWVKPTPKRIDVRVCSLPYDISVEHTNVTLFLDLFFVNKIPFLICKSEGINHISVQRLRNRTKLNISRKLEVIGTKYKSRGFNINLVYCAVRTVKDRLRSLCHSTPFIKYTRLMTIHVVLSAVKWINMFPSKGGISDHISPSKILEGADDPDMSVKRVPFGTYVLVYNKSNNDMEARSIPAISLSETN